MLISAGEMEADVGYDMSNIKYSEKHFPKMEMFKTWGCWFKRRVGENLTNSFLIQMPENAKDAATFTIFTEDLEDH